MLMMIYTHFIILRPHTTFVHSSWHAETIVFSIFFSIAHISWKNKKLSLVVFLSAIYFGTFRIVRQKCPSSSWTIVYTNRRAERKHCPPIQQDTKKNIHTTRSHPPVEPHTFLSLSGHCDDITTNRLFYYTENRFLSSPFFACLFSSFLS